MDFDAAIFDLDGTLLDSMDVWEHIDIQFLQKRNIPVPDGYVTEICARSFEEAAQYTIELFGLPRKGIFSKFPAAFPPPPAPSAPGRGRIPRQFPAERSIMRARPTLATTGMTWIPRYASEPRTEEYVKAAELILEAKAKGNRLHITAGKAVQARGGGKGVSIAAQRISALLVAHNP